MALAPTWKLFIGNPGHILLMHLSVLLSTIFPVCFSLVSTFRLLCFLKISSSNLNIKIDKKNLPEVLQNLHLKLPHHKSLEETQNY